MSEERKMAVYVVQRRGENPQMWFDIATVEVPARTKRLTVIDRALGEAGLHPSEGPVAVRVLPAAAAEVLEMRSDVPVEPRWKVAGVEGVVDAVAEHLGLGDESGKALYPGDVS